MSLRCLAAVAGAVLVIAPALQATAYVTKKSGRGDDTHWASTDVGWFLDPAGSDDLSSAAVRAELQAAFDLWEGVSCATIGFTDEGSGSSPRAGSIYVSFEEQQWDSTVGDALAFAVTEQRFDGRVDRAWITFNGVDVRWTNDPLQVGIARKDVQAVAAHEIGHAIGFDHSVEREAIMYFTASGDPERALHADDARGACYLYPATPFADGRACDSCSDAAHCANDVCINYPDDDAAYCGGDCASVDDCRDGFKCISVGNVGNQCVPRTERCTHRGGAQPVGGACWGHQMCASGLCLVFSDEAYCTRTCRSGRDEDCPSGMICLGDGGEGTCVRGGGGDLGDPCTSSIQCETRLCYVDICSQRCDGDGDCPAGTPCSGGFCIPPGQGPFGADCTSSSQCASSFCTGPPRNFCTTACASDADCPGGSDCINDRFCSKVELSDAGGPCTVTEDCVAGLQCLPGAAGQPSACRAGCDPVADSGCADGAVCLWVVDEASGTVSGLCEESNGGRGPGGDCAVGVCQQNLACVPHGPAMVCAQDCRISDGAGCAPPGSCVSLGIADDPDHGVCLPEQPVTPTPDPAPDAGPTPDPGAPVTPDPGAPTADPGQRDTAVAPTPDPGTVAPPPADPGPPGGAEDEGGGGGCAGGASPWAPAVLALLLWRRRRQGVGLVAGRPAAR